VTNLVVQLHFTETGVTKHALGSHALNAGQRQVVHCRFGGRYAVSWRLGVPGLRLVIDMLWCTAEHGNLVEVQRLLSDASVFSSLALADRRVETVVDEFGCTVLHNAAASGTMLPHVLSHGVFLSTLALLTGNVQLVQYLIEVQNADINAIDQVTYLLARMSHIKSPSESICVVWLVVRTDSGPSQLRHIWVTPALVSL